MNLRFFGLLSSGTDKNNLRELVEALDVKIDIPLLPPPSPKPMFDLSQGQLLLRINEYLQSISYQAISTQGCCHGLTLTWFNYMKDEREEFFYRLNEKIILYSKGKLAEISDEIHEFLLPFIFAQYSSRYIPELLYTNVDKILEIERFIYFQGFYLQSLTQLLSFYQKQMGIFKKRGCEGIINIHQEQYDGIYSTKDFHALIKKNSLHGNMICISNGLEMQTNDKRQIRHTVGVFVRNGMYFAYDANDKFGRGRQFETLMQLETWLRFSLYKNISLPEPINMNLEIKIIESPELQHKKMLAEVNSNWWTNAFGKLYEKTDFLRSSIFCSGEDGDEDVEAQISSTLLLKKNK